MELPRLQLQELPFSSIKCRAAHPAREICHHLQLVPLLGLKDLGHPLLLARWVVFLRAGHPFSRLLPARQRGSWVEPWSTQRRELRKPMSAWHVCWLPTTGGQPRTKYRNSSG